MSLQIHHQTERNRGGRVSSPQLRETLDQSRDFCGLEESVKPFDLLTLVKRAGKFAGFSAKMIELLEHYMVLTRACDWEEGSQPIVYKSQEQTALDLDLSVRHIRRLEKELFEIGALTWQDSGNHKRYGQRCSETGRILYAFGVDLTPLAYLKAQLEEIVHEQQLYKAAWMETKRQISWHRSQIKSILAEMVELKIEGQGTYQLSYDEIATRYSTRESLESMRSLLGKHQSLYQDVLTALNAHYQINKTSKESCKTDSNVRHKQDTNQNQSNKLDTRRATPNGFQKSCNKILSSDLQTSEQTDLSVGGEGQGSEDEPDNIILKSGLQHITGKQLLNAASDRFKSRIPMHNRAMNIDDIVDAAYALRPDLHISQQSWAKACEVLTRYGAAVCVLLVDQAVQREDNPVRKPAAYFNAMISKARAGDLYLQRSVFGLLKREYGEGDHANSDTPRIHNQKG